ncbi:MAG TPA: TetR/AcrR family transcriptional regulator [Thermoleophilaceae bacterium]|nr:TetR/AcrR family transcriptional regulator [Thermoleophilaceae bacterium]
MEASVAAPRRLDGEKARSIVQAMRASVAERGAAGSTFDHVARDAGVSRGLLHYYFGSKERLLVEVVRHDCDERVAALEKSLAGAGSPDEIVEALVEQLKAFLEDDPGSPTVVYEMLSASRHSEEIRLELAELYRTWRAHLAESLRAKEAEGVVTLDAGAEEVAAVIFALGDGIGMQLLSDPDWDSSAALQLGTRSVRRLLAQ